MFWTDYSKGSVSIGSYELQDLIEATVKEWEGGTHIYISDRGRKVLNAEMFKKFAWKYHDHDSLSYGLNGRNDRGDAFPDCDDYSLYASSNLVVKGSLKQGWDESLCFGRMSYFSKSLGGWHSANVVVLTDGKSKWMKVFEPQDQKIKSFDDEVAVVRLVAI